MSFDWKEYVYLAEDLLNRGEEACLRSSISRAYYGVYCSARNKKNYQHYKPRRGENIHRIVIDSYKNSKNREEQKIGKNLDQLRRSRNHADYNEDWPIKKEYTERAIIVAKQIIASIL